MKNFKMERKRIFWTVDSFRKKGNFLSNTLPYFESIDRSWSVFDKVLLVFSEKTI